MSVNSIRHLLENAQNSSADKTALIFNQEHLTYSELFEKVNKVAHFFSTLNLPKGSRIGIYSHKCSEQVVAILALLSSDFVLVPITRLLKPEQVQHIVDDCQISCIITDTHKIDALKALDFEGKIITYHANEQSDVSFDEMYKCYDGSLTCNINSHDNAVITYSFGSSGNPKGIVITHRSLIEGARIVSNYIDLKADDIVSGVLSFNLDYGLNQIFVTLFAQATLAIHHFVLPNDFFNHIINDKVTVLALMPIHITQMFDDDIHKIPHANHLNNVRCITSSGGNITNLMIKNINTHFKAAAFYSMHGLSEAFRSAFLDPKQINIRPNSIGKAVPDVELFIINEEGEACEAREIGELIHRGACIYKGYWNAPKETAERFKSIKVLEKVIDLEHGLTDEIIVASGDYVYKDEEDYLYFVSRKDDMIKTQGFRVSPYEIESVVYNNIPAISSCSVFSVDNSEIEEEIVLVYNADHELARNEIIFELKKHLPNYMIPAQIFYNREMPLKSLHDQEVNKETLKTEMLRNNLL
ncbi:MAG: AMP-binding protein [Campylobacterota bacterium]|nr:AMP-binding protein [Campylobacterota bacterium]